MTLVAAFWDHGHPVLIGDLLLTRGIPTDGFCLPTVGEVECTDGVRYVSSIQRKVVRISNQLCIGWTGAVTDALGVAGRLYREFHTSRTVTRAEFFDFIGKTAPPSEELFIVGLFLDEEGLFTFQWECGGNRLNFGWNYFCGSGRDYLDRYDEFDLMKTEEDLPDNSSGLVEAVRKCALLLGDEVTSGSTLAMNFGGGVELATYSEGGLKLVDAVAFVFFRCNFENGYISNIDYFHNIIINKYFDELLYVCSVTRDTDQNPVTRIYQIPPFVGEYNKNIKLPQLSDFVPKTVAFYFEVCTSSTETSLVLVDICFEPVNECTSFEVSENGIEIKLEPRFIDNISKHVAERLKSKY